MVVFTTCCARIISIQTSPHFVHSKLQCWQKHRSSAAQLGSYISC